MCDTQSDDENFSSKINTYFLNDVIKEVIKTNCSNQKCKISDDCVELMCELTKTLVIEAALRAAKQAKSQNKTVVTLEHIENALPQIMLDFP